MNRLRRLPIIWPALILYAAILYLFCFYEVEKPYWLFYCQEDEISKCSAFFLEMVC
jgi:hypothetical protein